MDNTTIGSIIATLRYKKGYSRIKLCQGLCSTQMLIKIEHDEVETDKFMLDMLLQRLGKSTDKLEIILSDEEYEKMYARDYIEELVWKKELTKTRACLEKYEKQYAKNNVQKMFILRTRAYISRNLEDDAEKAEILIRQAIEMTLPGISWENTQKYLMAGNEVENVLELGRCLLEQEKYEEAERWLNGCQKYIDTNITDGVEYAGLNSKSSWLRACLYRKKKKYIECYQVCADAIEGLRKYGILYFMMPLLEQLVFCSEQLGIDANMNKWKIYYDSLADLYRNYGEEWYCYDSLFHNCHQTVFHLDSEFIRQERQAKEMTQEQLIEGVYENPESLSRIEHGKAVPTKKNFEGLLTNLGIERGKYCGTAIMEDFELLEIKYETDILIGTGRYDAAEKNLRKLRLTLDRNKKLNFMLLEVYQSMIEIGRGDIDSKLAYEKLKKLLEGGILDKNGRIHRVPFYNELLALNMMCSCLRKMEMTEDAVKIYENIIEEIKFSKIDDKYQNNIMSLVLANINLFDPDKKWSDVGISYELACGKGNMLYMHIISQTEITQDEKTKRERTRLAYYMSDLFFRERNRLRIKKCYEQLYGEQLL